MPGTNYTTNLRLANPSLNDTGWGTTVSNGMIDLTDQAIAGQATADVSSSDVTLAIVDGSAGVNSARNMFLSITGTPGVARSVIVPTNRKLYFVTNTCGQTVTVKVSGQTGVAVPDTASMVLRINAAGTDVVQAFSYAASMSIGSITLGSALAATSGGTGQSSYAVGDLLYASSTTALSKLTVGAANAVLISSGTAPQWTATLGIASGGTGQATAATAFDALKQAATDAYTGVVELATTAEVQAGTDTTRAITPSTLRGGALVQGTAVNTTSGTTVDFTSIPSWAKRIVVMLVGVSTNGTSRVIVRIGTSSGFDVTGYSSEVTTGLNLANYVIETTAFALDSPYTASTDIRHGSLVLENVTGNTWVSRSTLYQEGQNVVGLGAGSKALSGVLDRVRVTTVNGTDTFDAGTINIMYE